MFLISPCNNEIMSKGLSYLVTALILFSPWQSAQAVDADAIIKATIKYWRANTSYAVFDMTIRRPDWQRTMSMRSWTRGTDQSLTRVIAPKKDAGNGTLLVKKRMWTYSPKINRIIKIPSSMMNQSWMGSDFSNNDISKSDDLINQYLHKLLRTEKRNGRTVYIIESIPKEDAPVVWGREIVHIRDDYVMLKHEFYNQEGKLAKSMVALEIKKMGGRYVASRQRMQKMDKKGEWTEVVTRQIRFNLPMPNSRFTLSNLRNPRR
jgi:outer membrane lipoprotein-sorting protein